VNLVLDLSEDNAVLRSGQLSFVHHLHEGLQIVHVHLEIVLQLILEVSLLLEFFKLFNSFLARLSSLIEVSANLVELRVGDFVDLAQQLEIEECVVGPGRFHVLYLHSEPIIQQSFEIGTIFRASRLVFFHKNEK